MTLGTLMQNNIGTLIDAFGYSLTFRRVTGGTYDVATGVVTGGSNSDETVTGLFTSYDVDEVDDTLVQRGDRKLLLKGGVMSKTPQTGDIFIGQGDAVRVVSVREIHANDAVVAFICQVRE